MNKLQQYQFKGVPFSSWLYRIAMSEVYQFFIDHKAERTINFETDKIKDLIQGIMAEKFDATPNSFNCREMCQYLDICDAGKSVA